MKKWMALCMAIVIICSMTAAFADELRVDFYDMGKADAMLITTPQGRRILIDTGTNKGGKALVDRFDKEEIDHIDTLIITHYDKDHVGGADKIIEDIGVGEIYMPVYEKDSKQYEQFVEAIEEAGGIDVHALPIGSRMEIPAEDGLSLSLTAAHKPFYGSDEENDFSLCLRMRYGETRFLFPGDAEAPRQYELLEEGDLACDVLKVPYHGRLVAASEVFLAAAAPKIAFIPDGEEDPASPVVIDLLKKLGAEVFLGREGGVTVVSDGHTVRVQ